MCKLASIDSSVTILALRCYNFDAATDKSINCFLLTDDRNGFDYVKADVSSQHGPGGKKAWLRRAVTAELDIKVSDLLTDITQCQYSC